MSSPHELVGRSEELALLDQAVSAGCGGVVLSGAAGVGKTALAQLALERVDGATRWIAATPALAEVPLGAIARLLPIGATPTPGCNTARWVVDMLSQETTGTIAIAIDDANQLDPQSTDVVVEMIRDPLVFTLVIVRSGEPLPAPLHSELQAAEHLRVELQPLAPNETALLTALVLGGDVDEATAHRVWDTTGGNPLFVKELATLGRDRAELTEQAGQWTWSGRWVVGDSVADLVVDRVRGAAADERDLLDVLALQEPLETTTATRLCGPSAIQRAVERATIRVAGDTLRLAHPVYREVLVHELDDARRAALSARLADEFEARGSERSSDVLRLVTLRLDSGAAVEPDLLARAARLAITFSDQPLAERLARAASATGAGPAAFVHLAEALYWQGRFNESLSVNAVVDLGGADDDLRAQAACCRASALLWGLDDGRSAISTLEHAEHELADVAARAEVRAHRASVLHMGGQVQTAAAIAGEIAADTASGVRGRARALGTLIQARALCGAPERAVAEAVHATDLALSLADELPTATGGIVMGRCLGLLLSGRANEFEAFAQVLLDLSLARPDDDFRGIWFFLRGRAALARGHTHTALARCHEAISLLRERDVGRVLPWCLGVAAQAAGQVRDAGLAVALAHEATERTGSFRVWETEIALGHAWAAAAAGERSRARELAFDAAATAASLHQDGSEVVALLEAIRLGGAVRARPRLDALVPRVDGPLAELTARYANAQVAEAGEELEAVADGFAALGAGLVAAEAGAAAAAALQGAGLYARAEAARRRAQARALESEGASLLELGATVLAELTDREREVAALAAQGLSRRDIASRLFVSERTVGNHLHRAYTKLGVSSATELEPLFRPERQRSAR